MTAASSPEDSGTAIHAGSRIEARDASGMWRPGTAVTGQERGRDFPVYWIEFDSYPGKIPWPTSDVRSAP